MLLRDQKSTLTWLVGAFLFLEKVGYVRLGFLTFNLLCRNPLALDMDGRVCKTATMCTIMESRNPLALDMGWNLSTDIRLGHDDVGSQSAFAGWGMEENSNR